MLVKVAVVGVGSIGMNHLRVLSDFPDDQVQVVGVADPDARVLAHAVNRYHIPGYANYWEMFAERTPDAVTVAVPTHLHYAISAHAL
ncbi:MAG TPA: Gfo/Idh/MocA family oxidoreductase, partial [Ktedonobacterales bacterium]|nr:Gfo/Idh/MocA family oxidoreductase [Ktedonobacterales bacterium]